MFCLRQSNYHGNIIIDGYLTIHYGNAQQASLTVYMYHQNMHIPKYSTNVM